MKNSLKQKGKRRLSTITLLKHVAVVYIFFPLLTHAETNKYQIDYQYNYSAVCLFIDFMDAKLPDPSNKQSFKQFYKSENSAKYIYKGSGVTAYFEKRQSNMINTKAYFLAETLPGHMRSANYLYSIFEIPSANRTNSQLSLGCDANLITFNFEGSLLNNIEISPEFID